MTSTILSLLDKRTAEEFHRRGDWGDRTIYGVIRDQAVAQPNANAISDRGRSLTYSQIQAAADSLASDLYARGVQSGDRVAYWLPDRVESVVIVLACSRNGYIV